MSEFSILFSRPRQPQFSADTLELEQDAADASGIESVWIPFEDIVDGTLEYTLQDVAEQPGRRWLYRGWMLTEREYGYLFDVFQSRGETLWTSPEQYALTHYIPNYYGLIQDQAANTRWTEGVDIAEAWAAAQELGTGPWTLKDHVKSAKEHWEEACFVPEGVTFSEFRSICEALVEFRGERFERGFVIREFRAFAALPFSTEQGELYDEHRLFVAGGKIIAQAPYHDVEAEPAPADAFPCLAAIDSPFFTADVARLKSGGWAIVELNDGGVSTLPPLLDPRALLSSLQEVL